MALHLPIGPLNPTLCWSQYRDLNPVPTSQLANDIATVLSGPVPTSFIVYSVIQPQMTSGETQAKLHIPRSERGDTGKYTIKVANQHGEETADIKVVVLGS